MTTKLLLFLCTALAAIHSNAIDITETHSYKHIDFDAITANTLVIFDVDETLIAPVDAYLINKHMHTPEVTIFDEQLLKKYPEVKDWNELASIRLLQSTRPLIETEIVEKIRNLQNRNIPVIALTAMFTGPWGIVDAMEEWRYNHLLSLGFQGSFTENIITFALNNRNPIFYKGILVTDMQGKGPVLDLFLNAMSYNPAHIVMFDDSLIHLESVQSECIKRGISFKGYHYKGAQLKKKTWDANIIQVQADYLVKNKRWLSDDEIKNLYLTV